MLAVRPQLARLAALIVSVLVLGALPAAASALPVTKTADTNDGTCDADCSLREAIEDTPAGGIVTLPASPAPYEVTDGLGTLLIAKDLTIAGAGARTTEVTAPGTNVRVFSVEGTGLEIVNVAIRDLSITGGDGNGGGQGAQGGGVLAFKDSGALSGPELTLERVRVAGNKVSVTSDGSQSVGGGIDADGAGTHLIVRDSLVVGNQALGTGGGGASAGGIATFASARATIENTTIAGNEAIGQSKGTSASRAGGLLVVKTSELINVTVFGNSTSRSDPLASPSRAGNLEAGPEVTLRNTLVGGGKAEGMATADCEGTFVSKGGNVLGPGCAIGVSDVFSTNLLLAPLADNGGPTDTIALLPGSPAIDGGVDCPAPAADQRGVPRPQGGRCDSGAFELELIVDPPPPPPKDLFCRNRKATLVGTDGKDRLVGTRRADVIVAKGGADTILARGGNDLVCAGPGNDTVKGGKGRDRLFGQAGRDVLRGGPGKDQLVGGPGKDVEVQ